MRQPDVLSEAGSAIASAGSARERGDAAAAREILDRAVASAVASGVDADELRAELALVLVDLSELDAAHVCLMACRPTVRDTDPAALLARAMLKWRAEGRTRESRAALESALSAAHAAGDTERAVAASVFIAEDQVLDGDTEGAMQRLRAALGEVCAPETRSVRARVLLGLANTLYRHEASSDAMAYARMALDLAGELDNPRLASSALWWMTAIHSQTGAKVEALDTACRSVDAARRSGDRRVIAKSLHCLASAHHALGDTALAVIEFERCVSSCRERGDAAVLCVALGGLGEALFDRGDVAAAEQRGKEALALATTIADRSSEVNAHALLARIAETKGDAVSALAEERARFRIDGEIRFKQSALRLDRIRAELECERKQSEESRKSERALRDALADVKRLEARLSLENQCLREEIVATGGFEEIVGRTEPLKRVLQKIAQVAPTDASVLISGETGVGKELVARAIHARSRRRDRALVTVNCAALPATLIESELFGHEKGAFTGALHRKLGRFELADGGTIFLDEIGDLPLDLQAKLLRVLQEGEFERLGDSVTRRTDTRVVAATNRDLRTAISEGKFRPDLYYRLAVFTIDVPPLRERRDDIPLLVAHFAMRYQSSVGKRIERIPEETMRRFTACEWPGNVRELANVVQRAVILSTGDALVLDGLFDMPPPRHSPSAPVAQAAPDSPPASAAPPADDSLKSAERVHVLRVLESCGWNIKGKGNAADRLGMPPSTLRSRMTKLGIARETRG